MHKAENPRSFFNQCTMQILVFNFLNLYHRVLCEVTGLWSSLHFLYFKGCVVYVWGSLVYTEENCLHPHTYTITHLNQSFLDLQQLTNTKTIKRKI